MNIIHQYSRKCVCDKCVEKTKYKDEYYLGQAYSIYGREAVDKKIEDSKKRIWV